MHPDEAVLARLVDGEPGAGAEELHAHLRGCAECRAHVETARAEAEWLERRLRALDHVPPAVTVAEVVRRAGRKRFGGPLGWAASVALALGLGGVAWAAPGSPLPGLARRVVALVSGEAARAPGQAEVPAAGVLRADAGIALPPGPELVIVFGPASSEGSVRVWLADGREVEVRAPTGAATFTAGEQRVLVDRAGEPAEFEVRIPRDAPRVEIRAGTRRLFLAEGGRVTTTVPETGGSYLLSLR